MCFWWVWGIFDLPSWDSHTEPSKHLRPRGPESLCALTPALKRYLCNGGWKRNWGCRWRISRGYLALVLVCLLLFRFVSLHRVKGQKLNYISWDTWAHGKGLCPEVKKLRETFEALGTVWAVSGHTFEGARVGEEALWNPALLWYPPTKKWKLLVHQ